MSELDLELSIWVEEEELGKGKVIEHEGERYEVKIPKEIHEVVTVRLSGLGKTEGNRTGSLLLHVRLNKGADIRKSLWLSETSARNGTDKVLRIDKEKKIRILIPEKSRDGLVLRLRGLGQKPAFRWGRPFLHRKRGNLLVKLCVYPDDITPAYGSFENLSTDEMALEGWVYRKIDEISYKMGESSFVLNPIRADTVADLFNEYGWRGIFDALVGHLKLTHLRITLKTSDSSALPGECQKTTTFRNLTPEASSYVVTINSKFLDNPFSIAAIMAHELCHVVYYERLDDGLQSVLSSLPSEKPSVWSPKAEKDLRELERTVDLLVFMFKLGEFQLRTSRDRRLTLGYFNQVVFERIQVIVSRKRSSF